MAEFEQLLMLLGLEGFALSSIVLLIVFIVWRRRQSAIRAGLLDFFSSVKTFAVGFEQRLQQQFIDMHKLPEVEAKKEAHHLTNLVLLLSQSYIDSMRSLNAEGIKKFSGNVQTLADSFQQYIKQPESTAETESDAIQLEEKVKQVKSLELALESKDKELIMTQKTLEQIMSEYSSMYTGSKDDQMDADEVLNIAHVDKEKLAVEAESEINKRKTATHEAVEWPETPAD